MPARTARLVDPADAETIGVLGPTIRILTPAEGVDDAPCVMRGALPPGGVVPLHSHPDPETFLVAEGTCEGLVHDDGGGSTWMVVGPGEVFHVPGGVPHAWRGAPDRATTMLIVTTVRMARFFREIGTPAGTRAPSRGDAARHLRAVARRYGHWNATPEENAEIGIHLPG